MQDVFHGPNFKEELDELYETTVWSAVDIETKNKLKKSVEDSLVANGWEVIIVTESLHFNYCFVLYRYHQRGKFYDASKISMEIGGTLWQCRKMRRRREQDKLA